MPTTWRCRSLSGAKQLTATNVGTFTLLSNGAIPSGGGATPFGVTSASAPSYTGLISTNIPQMQNANASAYMRIPFQVDDLTNLSSMTLNVKYDDGYVAYLNGVEIAQERGRDRRHPAGVQRGGGVGPVEPSRADVRGRERLVVHQSGGRGK